jgi:hypothetical protein
MVIELATIAFHRNHFYFAIFSIGYTERALFSICWKGEGVYYPSWISVHLFWFNFERYFGVIK